MTRTCYLLLLIFIWACGPGTGNTTFYNLSDMEQAKFEKYMILGKGVYSANCTNCHQIDGKGLQGLIPPLAAADYLANNQLTIPCLLKNGRADSVRVNGVNYAPQMPAHKISNLELAEVITYINNSWGNEYGFMQVIDIDKILRDCN
jgi:cytochrome c551